MGRCGPDASLVADVHAWPKVTPGRIRTGISGWAYAPWWADRVRTWAAGGEPEDAERVLPPTKAVKGRDVFVYFDNDVKVRAPKDALSLAERVG